jgi:hypothetical protein
MKNERQSCFRHDASRAIQLFRPQTFIRRSGSFTVVEVEHAAQPLTPLDSITMETNDGSGTIDQLIADSLMISFPRKVRHVLRQRAQVMFGRRISFGRRTPLSPSERIVLLRRSNWGTAAAVVWAQSALVSAALNVCEYFVSRSMIKNRVRRRNGSSGSVRLRNICSIHVSLE